MSVNSSEDLPENYNHSDLIPIPKLTDQTDQLAEQSDELADKTDQLSDSIPASTSSSKDEIETNQEMIEKQLNLEKDPVTSITNKELDTETNGTKEVKRQRKPTRMYIEMVQSITNNVNNDLANKKHFILENENKLSLLRMLNFY